MRLARAGTAANIRALEKIRDGTAQIPWAVRLEAIQTLLAYGWGKPPAPRVEAPHALPVPHGDDNSDRTVIILPSNGYENYGPIATYDDVYEPPLEPPPAASTEATDAATATEAIPAPSPAPRLSNPLAPPRDFSHVPRLEPVPQGPAPAAEPPILSPDPRALGMPHKPRITSEDSHTCIVEPGGKVVWIPNQPPPPPKTYAQVCEEAGATLKHVGVGPIFKPRN